MDNSQPRLENLDECNYRSDSAIKKALGESEQVILSTVLYKFNKDLKRQERSILITSKAIYNVNKQDFLANVISIFKSNFQIRRRIDFNKLHAITVSELSNEFVLHVPDEYDYRYASFNKRDQILSIICRVHSQVVPNRKLLFFFKPDVTLIKFTTTEYDKKKGISRIPTEGGMVFDNDSLKVKLDDLFEQRKKLAENTETVFNKQDSQKVTLEDFDILKVLGRGAFGKVMLVEKKGTKKVYAMKSLHKEDIIDKEQIEHTKTERFVLEKSSNSPFLVSLQYAFQTPAKIFFVMSFMRGGELFQHLRTNRRFDEKRTKFYAAEILLGIEALHKLGVIYRDLKPENVLMDEFGHVCLSDFGMAKRLEPGELTKSFVGTPEYLAPEIIHNKGHGRPVDWWALGVLVYEMLYGTPPFFNKEQNHHQMFKQITNDDVDFSSKFKVSADAKNFIARLLSKDPEKRLGSKGADEIKEHDWFSDVDWEALSNKQVTPPFVPKVSNEYDVGYFDEEFTSEDAENSYVNNGNMNLIKKHQSEFQDFTYVPKTLMKNDK